MTQNVRIEGDQLVSETRISMSDFVKQKKGEMEFLQIQIDELVAQMNQRIQELESLTNNGQE